MASGELGLIEQLSDRVHAAGVLLLKWYPLWL